MDTSAHNPSKQGKSVAAVKYFLTQLQTAAQKRAWASHVWLRIWLLLFDVSEKHNPTIMDLYVKSQHDAPERQGDGTVLLQHALY